jgi:predicted TIM-barrel fold metal-dependent hydrolase
MIVDCHTHILSDNIQNLDVSEHLGAADVVDKCFVLGSFREHDDSSEQVNNRVSKYVERYNQKMLGFAFINPLVDDTSVKNLKASTEKLGLKGIVLYCTQTPFHPAQTKAMQLYDSAQELRLPVFFHNTHIGSAGLLEYARPFLLDEVARAFPKLKIIIGNLGFPFYDQTFCLLASHQNVFADLSIKPGNHWQIYNIIISAFEQGVMDKLLFGSAFPAAAAKDCIEALLGFNKLPASANLPSVPRSAIQAVLERNTLKILGIEN